MNDVVFVLYLFLGDVIGQPKYPMEDEKVSESKDPTCLPGNVFMQGSDILAP